MTFPIVSRRHFLLNQQNFGQIEEMKKSTWNNVLYFEICGKKTQHTYPYHTSQKGARVAIADTTNNPRD